MELRETIETRIKAFQKSLQQKRIDAAIVYKPENVFFFSNFNQIINSTPALIVIPKDGEATLLVDARRYAHARHDSGLQNVQCYGSWRGVETIAPNPYDALFKLLGPSVKELGICFQYSNYAFEQQISSRFNAASLTDITYDIDEQKMIKDDLGIEKLRKAAELASRGMEATVEALRSGMTEAQACTEGQYAMRKLWQSKYPESEIAGFGAQDGAMVDALQVWCLSNEKINHGCDCPQAYRPQSGDITLPQVWAKLDGYHAEIERTLLVGEVTGERAKAYEATSEAREAVLALLKPGAVVEDLFHKAVEVFSDHGFGDILPRSIGHGVGNSAHQFPFLSKGNKLKLMPRMVLSLEIGLVEGSWGSVRQSDIVLITDDGYELLTQHPAGELRL